MDKPQQILDLEKSLGKKIKKLNKIGILSVGYLEEDFRIIGLSLYDCDIREISFLSDYPDLKILNLTKNQIFDISLLQKMNYLQELY
jgi:hypothetical protein